jgi:hypothetical protein
MTSGPRHAPDAVEIPGDGMKRITTAVDQSVKAGVAESDERMGLNAEIELEKKRKRRRAILAKKKPSKGWER